MQWNNSLGAPLQKKSIRIIVARKSFSGFQERQLGFVDISKNSSFLSVFLLTLTHLKPNNSSSSSLFCTNASQERCIGTLVKLDLTRGFDD
jgi:hypothetical protein